MSTIQATNHEIFEQFEQFFREYYRDEIGRLAQAYPAQSSLMVDWMDLFRFEQELARDLIEQPEQILIYANEALTNYDLPTGDELNQARMRIVGLSEEDVYNVGFFSPADARGQLRGIRGQVVRRSQKKSKIVEAAFECHRCGSFTHIPQSRTEFTEPHECQGCERQGPFKINFDQSRFVDHQRLRLQTPPEKTAGTDAHEFDVVLTSDLVGDIETGDRIIANVIVRLSQDSHGSSKEPTFEPYGETISYERVDVDYKDLDLDEYEDQILEVVGSDTPIETVIDSIAPSLKGLETIKEAIALQIFGGVTKELPDGARKRGSPHILCIGDPGVGKSQVLQYVDKLVPRSIYTTGAGSTRAGLTASAVQTDFGGGGWTLEAGALVKAHLGITAIDELDDMHEEDRAGMLEAMSQQQISVSKAGMNATLPAETTVLAGANPEQGRFDPYNPIAEQFDLDATLISRFDLIFTMMDEPDEDRDRAIAQHVNKVGKAGQQLASGMSQEEADTEDVEPELEADVVRAYIAYARENVTPVLSTEAEEVIEDQYVAIRTANDDADGPVPTTPRTIEAMHRLAEASARIRLSETVSKRDALRAVDIIQTYLHEVGIDPETGEMDVDLIETGQSKSQRERKQELQAIIKDLSGNYDFGAPEEEIISVATDLGHDESKIEHELQTMLGNGKIWMPKSGNSDEGPAYRLT